MYTVLCPEHIPDKYTVLNIFIIYLQKPHRSKTVYKVAYLHGTMTIPCHSDMFVNIRERGIMATQLQLYSCSFKKSFTK